MAALVALVACAHGPQHCPPQQRAGTYKIDGLGDPMEPFLSVDTCDALWRFSFVYPAEPRARFCFRGAVRKGSVEASAFLSVAIESPARGDWGDARYLDSDGVIRALRGHASRPDTDCIGSMYGVSCRSHQSVTYEVTPALLQSWGTGGVTLRVLGAPDVDVVVEPDEVGEFIGAMKALIAASRGSAPVIEAL